MQRRLGRLVLGTSLLAALGACGDSESLLGAGRSEANANPRDTKDHPEGVWTLPPALRLKDRDREKYLAIGESDRFTLKFIKR